MNTDKKNQVRLNQIASIQTGVFAQTVNEGEFNYLQVRHFNENGQFNNFIIPDKVNKDRLEKHLLKEDDILFAAKGTKNFSAVYRTNNIGASVASSSFLILRIRDQQILPEYIAWYLNHPKTQSYLKIKARGTALPSISIETLADLEIPVPDLKKQKAIVKIAELKNREKYLWNKISELNEKYIQYRLLKTITQ